MTARAHRPGSMRWQADQGGYDHQGPPPPEFYEHVGRLNAERDRYRQALVRLYREAPLPVSRVCDEFLDPSGRLLGEIRREARNR